MTVLKIAVEPDSAQYKNLFSFLVSAAIALGEREQQRLLTGRYSYV